MDLPSHKLDSGAVKAISLIFDISQAKHVYTIINDYVQRLLMEAAAQPAPKPLSTFTTVSPEAHEFNIAKRGTNPLR